MRRLAKRRLGLERPRPPCCGLALGLGELGLERLELLEQGRAGLLRSLRLLVVT